MGFSLHYLLVKLTPTLTPGDLDYCMPTLVKLLLADLFGEAAEKKEVEEIANKMKETRSTRSYSSFELLGTVIQFVPNINLLVPPLHTAVTSAPGGFESLKNLNVARDVLRHTALGLAVNPTVELQPLCVYVRGMLVTHLPNKQGATASGSESTTPRGVSPGGKGGGKGSGKGSGKIGGRDGEKRIKGGDRPEDRLQPDSRKKPKKKAAVADGDDQAIREVVSKSGGSQTWAPVGTVLQPETEAGVTSSSGRSPLAHEFLAFGIGLLATALKRGRFSASDPSHLALLEPLLQLLQRAMRVDSDAVVSLALRTVGALMSYPLPSLPIHATALLDRTLSILKRAANTKGTELVGIGVKVVTTLLRRPPVPSTGKMAHASAIGGAAKRLRDGEPEAEGALGGVDDEDGDNDDDDEGEEEAEDASIKLGDSTDMEAAVNVLAKVAPRVGGGANLSEHQLRWLTTFVSVHLDDTVLQNSLFGLLRVIFGRKYVPLPRAHTPHAAHVAHVPAFLSPPPCRCASR